MSNILTNFYKSLLNNNNDDKYRDSVVTISRDGVLREYFLDEMPYNHAKCTCYMALKLGIPYFETNLNMVAGDILAFHGVLVLHIHKAGICICFFPKDLNEGQYDMLNKRLKNLNEFSFQYKESCLEEGFVSIDNVLEYAFNIVVKEKKEDSFKVLKKQKD